jgi:hypothetical protein
VIPPSQQAHEQQRQRREQQKPRPDVTISHGLP